MWPSYTGTYRHVRLWPVGDCFHLVNCNMSCTQPGLLYGIHMINSMICSQSYCNTVRSAIGTILSSVRLSVTLYTVAWRKGLKVASSSSQEVPRKALPIHFFRHFCCSMYRSATKHSKNQTAEISASGIAMGRVVTSPWLFQRRHFRRFGSATIAYIVCSTIGHLNDSYPSCSVCQSITHTRWTGSMLVGVHSNCQKSESCTLDRLEPTGNIEAYIVTVSPSTSLVENVIEFVSNTVHCPINDPVPFTEM